jgi:hypothetical protein
MIVTLSSVSAQDNNKPMFSTIEFVSYEVTEKGEIDLDSYTQFTSNGSVKMRDKIFNRRHITAFFVFGQQFFQKLQIEDLH